MVLTLPLGDKKLAGIGADDIGKGAYGIFKQGPILAGKTIGVAGRQLTGPEMATALTQALGQDVEYQDISLETYRGLGFPGADDLSNMFRFYQDFEPAVNAARDVAAFKELNPALRSLEEWLAENVPRIPLDKP
jgi:uncharacterized protein YbjT (DUF2867 family)